MAFVTINKADFEGILAGIDADYELVSGNEDTTCWEYVYEVDTPKKNVAVRIYSTVDKRTGHTRDKGEDAIRIVHWDTANDRPIGKGRKILRVEGATTVQERIAARIADLVARSKAIEVVSNEYVRAVLVDNAPHDNFAQILLEKLNEYDSLTTPQLAYVLGEKNPKGWDTMEAKSKKQNPDFWTDHITMGTDDGTGTPPDAHVRGSAPVIPERHSNITGQHRAPVLGGQQARGRVVTQTDYTATETRIKQYTDSEAEDIEKEIVITTTEQPGKADGSNLTITPGATSPQQATSEYTPWQYPFAKFNPVQTATLPYTTMDVNLVIAANTSAGKTVCAELAMDHTLNHQGYGEIAEGRRRNRVIYLSPLKSLTQEKYEDWAVRFPDRIITILTGDYTLSETMKEKLAASDIIVMTSEMADSRTRRMHTEKNYWLKEVGLVIVDETHIISTDRGHAVESGLMRFTSINRDARILLLSATMPNCKELAEWTTKLNGKDSHIIQSTWRPVTLEMNYVDHPILKASWGGPDYQGTQNVKRSLTISIATGNHMLAQGKEEEKFLIFCHDKGTGRAIESKLTKMGISCFFHSADLEMKERLRVEKLFSDSTGGIRILVSTSTLAWGRNLPARNVIIVGVHRGIQDVDELDIIQMAGRAGRLGIDTAGTVFLLVPEGTAPAWKYTFNNPRPIHSGFVSRKMGMTGHPINRNVLAFHVLAEVENKAVTSVEDIDTWFGRSLASHQDPDCFCLQDAEALLDELKNMEMLDYKGAYVNPFITGLGKVSAWLYYSPYDVFGWYSNFSKFFDKDNGKMERNDLTLTWALCDIDSNDWGYVPKDLKELTEEWAWKLRSRGVQPSDAVCSAIAGYYCITNQKLEGTLGPLGRTLIYDIRRISQAIKLIDKQYAKWDQEAMWEVLPQRIMYGISEDMVELVSLAGIGGVTARKLFERGIKTFMSAAKATDAFINARIGQISTRPWNFYTVMINEQEL
ncbi:hypothetical protein LCGC14_0799540, partial [marine sediment metagenome]